MSLSPSSTPPVSGDPGTAAPLRPSGGRRPGSRISTGAIVAVAVAGIVLLAGLVIALVWVLGPGGGDGRAAMEVDAVEAAAEDLVLPEGDAADLEVVLSWSSAANLELQVVDPDGNVVSDAAPVVSSGGELVEQANRACAEAAPDPSERVVWGQGEAPTGDYTVRVQLAESCGPDEGPQPFELSVVMAGGTAASIRDEIGLGERLDLVLVSHPNGVVQDLRPTGETATDELSEEDASSDRADASDGDADDGSEASQVAPDAPPAAVVELASGLFCRDLHAMGRSYAEAVAYWLHEGRPERMDASRNGIPCQTVYPRAEVVAYWGLLPSSQVPSPSSLASGLFCRDLHARGLPYWDAVTYWELEGRPARMDAAGNGIPCQTVYPRRDVVAYWGWLVD